MFDRGFPPWSAQITDSGSEAKVVPNSRRKNVIARGIGMERGLQASRRTGEKEAGTGGDGGLEIEFRV